MFAGGASVRVKAAPEAATVTKPSAKTNIETSEPFMEFDLIDPDIDAQFEQLTIRDLAAILLKKPVSNKKWLNKLITDN